LSLVNIYIFFLFICRIGDGFPAFDSAFSFLVGNIPYELTEDQLTDVFKEVGPVLSFRFVLHKVLYINFFKKKEKIKILKYYLFYHIICLVLFLIESQEDLEDMVFANIMVFKFII
jgi:RNA recognition motif-containing protein